MQLPMVDVLVAVADPRATAALAMGDELYWAARRYTRTKQHYEQLGANEGISEPLRQRRRERLRQSLQNGEHSFRTLEARYHRLISDLDHDLLHRVEEVVWRDRNAEYAHNHAIAARVGW